jgi:hypothetical protein
MMMLPQLPLVRTAIALSSKPFSLSALCFFFRTKKWLELCYRLHLCIDSGNRRRYQAIVGLESEEGGFTEDVSKTGSKVQDREVRNKKPNTRVSGLDWVK